MTITHNRLREVLQYDPHTGNFTRVLATSPNVRIGEIAGCDDSDGYRIIRIDGRPYKAHRLAFLFMTGALPRNDVDHANGDPSDNRWINLREASRSQNVANSRRSRNNSSGFKGVHWHKPLRKWCSRIAVNGKRITLGFFDNPTDAHAAYREAATKKFGKFANGGSSI